MPVRDVAPYLDRSIESILGQSYDDFEFIIRDDGSVDGSRDILRKWRDSDRRIRLFESDTSMGPAGSANWVVAQASGDVIARMDGDDIAHPDRLRQQLEALLADPEACLVGTLADMIDHDGRRVRPRDRSRLARPSPFAPFPHGSIMFRREAFAMVGGYRAAADFWEDLDLYRRMSRCGRLIVLPASLYRHRASLLSTRLTSDQESVEASVDRMYRTVLRREAAGASGRRLPRVYVSLGSTRLWAGKSPDAFRKVIRNAALRWDLETLLTLIWAAWGAVSPRTLRLCLKCLFHVRDGLAGRKVRDGRVYSWNCPSAEAEPPIVTISPLRDAA